MHGSTIETDQKNCLLFFGWNESQFMHGSTIETDQKNYWPIKW